MGYTNDEMKEIKKSYKAEFKRVPFDEYVNGLGISNLKVQKEIKKIEFPLREGESLDDLCLSVYLRKELESDLSLPSHYRGARVFYEVVGEIVAF